MPGPFASQIVPVGSCNCEGCICAEVPFRPAVGATLRFGVVSPPGGWKRLPHQGSLVPNQSGRAQLAGKALPDATGPMRNERAVE
jgi:hypothetical protein